MSDREVDKTDLMVAIFWMEKGVQGVKGHDTFPQKSFLLAARHFDLLGMEEMAAHCRQLADNAEKGDD